MSVHDVADGAADASKKTREPPSSWQKVTQALQRSQDPQDWKTSDQYEKLLSNLNNGYSPCDDSGDAKSGVHFVSGNFAEASAGSGEIKVVVVTSTTHPQVLSPQAAALVQDIHITDEARRALLPRLRLLQQLNGQVIMMNVKTGPKPSTLTCAFLGVTDSCLPEDLTSEDAQARYPELTQQSVRHVRERAAADSLKIVTLHVQHNDPVLPHLVAAVEGDDICKQRVVIFVYTPHGVLNNAYLSPLLPVEEVVGIETPADVSPSDIAAVRRMWLELARHAANRTTNAVQTIGMSGHLQPIIEPVEPHSFSVTEDESIREGFQKMNKLAADHERYCDHPHIRSPIHGMSSEMLDRMNELARSMTAMHQYPYCRTLHVGCHAVCVLDYGCVDHRFTSTAGNWPPSRRGLIARRILPCCYVSGKHLYDWDGVHAHRNRQSTGV